MSISQALHAENAAATSSRFHQMSTSVTAGDKVRPADRGGMDRRFVSGGLLSCLVMSWEAAQAQEPAAQGGFARTAVSPFTFGAKGDGFSDDTAAFEAALATGAPVDAGSGRFRLTRGLKIRAGQVLRGESARACFFLVDHEFDRSAAAVIDLQGPEPGGELRDVAISFSQPNTNDRAQLLPYPAAIRAQAVPRIKLSRLRIERARIAVDIRGNSGGAVLDDLEISAFDRAIWIDGALDSVKITKLHIWPFGLTRPQRAVYDDAINEGLRIGRCDDLTISQGLLFGLRRAAVFHRSERGAAFGTLTGVDFDHCGGLICEAANIRVVGCIFTLGVPDGVWLKAGQGLVSVVGSWFHAAKELSSAGIVSSDVGLLTMSNCVFNTGGNDFVHLSIGGATTFNCVGLTFAKQGGIKYSKPLILVAPGAKGAISSLVATPSAGGDLLRSASKDASALRDVDISGIQAEGWGRPR